MLKEQTCFFFFFFLRTILTLHRVCCWNQSRFHTVQFYCDERNLKWGYQKLSTRQVTRGMRWFVNDPFQSNLYEYQLRQVLGKNGVNRIARDFIFIRTAHCCGQRERHALRLCMSTESLLKREQEINTVRTSFTRHYTGMRRTIYPWSVFKHCAVPNVHFLVWTWPLLETQVSSETQQRMPATFDSFPFQYVWLYTPFWKKLTYFCVLLPTARHGLYCSQCLTVYTN